ncbi:MAG: cobalamin biosynthesis protein CbiM [Chlorobiaceae bacterium]|nr:cobalamin biosynthesis protein CbiM [Chlorobiaceae bacterium]NTW74392.1 cobalamin biosynthesis protein CbiM [Chlorobiaceae bacterium]
MHMADALLSPVVGGTFWAVSAGMIGRAAKKISGESNGSKTVLMGVLGSFVFAAQMINFTIPGTGSSGHIGGGLLLAVLLGPWRAFVTLASVLVIQALFFADGGLLALGCNIFNLAFFPAFIAWPFIYRPIAGDGRTPVRLAAGSIIAAMAGLLMGSFSVVLQTTLSGISDLPFNSFVLFMLPVHALIGFVEGLLTWGVLSLISRTEPALLSGAASTGNHRRTAMAMFVAAITTGGLLSWFASTNPDGLEWSIARVTGVAELHATGDPVHTVLADLQQRLAPLPDYSFRSNTAKDLPADAGTTFSGIAGSLLVLVLAGSAGLFLKRREPTGGQ